MFNFNFAQRIHLSFILSLVIFATTFAFSDSTTTSKRTVMKLAEGIYEIRHPDAPDTFPQSNTVVIIGDKAVFVVDSCLLPSSAREDIAQIRQWTSKPVTYLLNTHWHFDHTLGNASYAAAFPGVQIIAQQHTAKIIADFNSGAMARYPQRAERFKQVLASGKATDGHTLTDSDRKDYERALAGLPQVVAEMRSTTQLAPNISFDDELNIDLGNRTVEIRFFGRANTAGDTIVYLPKEKIAMVGDILDHPVPYFFGGFPVDLIETLEKVKSIGAEVFIPGHGDILHGTTYFDQVIAMVRAVNLEIENEINDGKTLQETQALVPRVLETKINEWRQQFAGSNEEDRLFFDTSFAGLITSSYNQQKAR